MMKQSNTVRITTFLVIVYVFMGGLIYRLVSLTNIQHAYYAQTAQAQKEHMTSVLARGTIYFNDRDRVLSVAAANKKFPVLEINAEKIEASTIKRTSQQLAEATGIPMETISKVLEQDRSIIRTFPKHLTDEQAEKVRVLNIKGASISYEVDRFYPNQELAADVLGFLGYEGSKRSGQYGVEAFYNEDLFGNRNTTGTFAAANVITKLFNRKTPQENNIDRPKDLVLTVDQTVQLFIEKKLEETVAKWNAAGGSIIVQDPHTGKIIAMADRPVFNPNAYAESPTEIYLNSTVQQIFEPGSSFKPITMAAGLDSGKISPETKYEDTGSVTIAGHTIRNYDGKAHGVRTMTQVLEKSLNTGSMFAENLMGDNIFLDYVVNMGFGQRTGIDVPGEISGDISNLYSGRKINFLTASFGQGVAVTPIQLINAYSAIANGGKLMRPYIVEKIVEEGGNGTVAKPQIIGIPIRERTAIFLQNMLVSVVDNGFDKARIAGYDIAGKTGTAQIADDTGTYAEGQYIHTFLGFAPAHNAKFVVMIKLDKPHGITFASDSLSPVFREITTFLLNYYNIAPTRK